MTTTKRFIPRIDGYAIDCFVTESHESSTAITKFDVEEGSAVSDHARAEPKVLVVEGVVTDSPSGKMLDERQGFSSSNTSDEADLFTTDYIFGILPSEEAIAVLDAIDTVKEPIVVETAIRVYRNMMMTSLVIPRDKETGRALRFTAKFEELRIRQLRREKIIVRDDVRAQPKNKGGNKSADKSKAGARGPTTAEIRQDQVEFSKEVLGINAPLVEQVEGTQYNGDAVDDDGRLVRIDKGKKVTGNPNGVDTSKNKTELPLWTNVVGPGVATFESLLDVL